MENTLPIDRLLVEEKSEIKAEAKPSIENVENNYITKLKEKGLYKSPAGNGKHNISCPWEQDHSAGDSETTVQYLEPNYNGHKDHAFKCLHASHSDKNIGDLRGFLFDPSEDFNSIGEEEEAINEDDNIEILRLAQLGPIPYDRERKDAAEKMGMRVSTLDGLVYMEQKRNRNETDSADDEFINGIEPWGSTVHGCNVADVIKEIFNRHTILPVHGDVALTLWTLGSYCYNSFRIFPKLCLSSPEKRCGKTTTLETLSAVVHRALVASNVSPSVIFRSIDLWHPRLLIDEADTFVSDNEELRGVINSGHTRTTAFVLRTEGENRQPTRFSTWAPMALAMIKTPPDTIQDRSLMITLRRKLQGEEVQRLPLDMMEQHQELRQKCQRWGEDSSDALKSAVPNIPRVGNDRAEDNWWPLIAITDLIGGEWPVTARTAMMELESKEESVESISIELLTDIRRILQSCRHHNNVSSKSLVDNLVIMEERPWCEWRRGSPMTQNSLARLLKPFVIKSKDIRIDGRVSRGFHKSDFSDVFSRYLPPFKESGLVELLAEEKGGWGYPPNTQ